MLHRLLDFLYRLSGLLVLAAGKIAACCVLLLVVVTVVDVFLRYFFQAGSVAVQELEWHLFSAIFLLGSAYTLQQDSHVRVDVVYSKLPTRGKAAIDLLGTLLFLLPFCWIGIRVGIPFVERSYELGEASADPGGLPMRYLPKALIVVGFALLLLEGFGLLLRSITRLWLGLAAEYDTRRTNA